MNKKYVIAYHKIELINWKFLCVDDGKQVTIVYDYDTQRASSFVGSTVDSDMYEVRDATQEDLDKAMVDKL